MSNPESAHWVSSEAIGAGVAIRSRTLIHLVRAAEQPRPVAWWRRWVEWVWKAKG